MDSMFRRLAACLELDELERALIVELRRDLPRCTAIVRIGPEPREPQLGGPRTGRMRASSRAGVLACPVESGGRAIGFIGYVDDAALAPQRATAEARLASLATAAAIPAANALRHTEALRLAYKDSLTGLYNRRAFTDYLEREGQRAGRHGRELAVILLDLDGLKKINDTLGHAAGDDALRALADVLQRTLRRVDIVARLGGDEFAVLCPDTGSAAARRVAGRIRRALSGRCAGKGDAAWPLAVSCGVSDFTASDGDVSRMVELADMDLYRVKRARPALPGAPARPRTRARAN